MPLLWSVLLRIAALPAPVAWLSACAISRPAVFGKSFWRSVSKHGHGAMAPCTRHSMAFQRAMKLAASKGVDHTRATRDCAAHVPRQRAFAMLHTAVNR